jgi:hypothetical protein
MKKKVMSQRSEKSSQRRGLQKDNNNKYSVAMERKRLSRVGAQMSEISGGLRRQDKREKNAGD